VTGILWSAGLSVAIQAPNFLQGLFLARIMGREAFGEWGIIQNTIGSVSNIAQLSLAVTATKYVAEFRQTDLGRVGRILGLCSAVTSVTAGAASLALLIAAPYLATHVLHAPQLTLALRISVGYLLFLTINGFQVGALSGLEAFDRLALIGAFYGAGSLAAVLLAAHYGGLLGALVAMSASAAANWLFHHIHLTRYCRALGIVISYQNLRDELSVLTRFAVPATLAGIAGSAGVWLSNVALVRAANGYREMALLTAAMSFRSVILFAPSVVSRVSVPVLVSLFGNKDHARYQRAYTGNLLLLTGAAIAVALPISLLAPYLLTAFGRSFSDGSSAVVALSLSTVFEVAAMALYQQIFASGWMWWGLSTVLMRCALLVAFAALLAPERGALGVASANAIAYGGSLALTYLIVRVKMPRLFRAELTT
jgi:O-antigen/teichoic acid export membrane protein